MSTIKLQDFDYNLPKDLIAQEPIIPKHNSRLLILNKKSGKIEHKHFYDIVDILDANTILIMNNSKVIPARLFARKEHNGALIEILLIKHVQNSIWRCFAKPAKRIKKENTLYFISNTTHLINEELTAKLVEKYDDGTLDISFNKNPSQVKELLKDYGKLALPPYIKKELEKNEYYQTCYAKNEGSIAAPTAGLHFTNEIINKLKNKGVNFEFIELQVGPGTFLPVKEDNILDHKMHSEYIKITQQTADNINKYKQLGKKIIVVGTTTCRSLESATNTDGLVQAFDGESDIFIYPGYKFKFTQNLLTNFHLPKSTLVMLVSALAKTKNIKKAYNKAIELKYRFYSFGDSMLITS